MKKVAIIQARMGSTRFPGKVLALLNKKPIIQWVVEAAQRIPMLDQVVVATSNTSTDQILIDWCNKNNVTVFAGSELDVLSRFYEASKYYDADVIVRITADCPLLDPHIAAQVLYLVTSDEADYASNTLPPTWPDGLDCEAFTIQALSEAHHQAKRASDREHVTPYIRNNQYKFRVKNVISAMPGFQKHRWTIDTKEDLGFIEKLIKHARPNATMYDFLEALKNNQDIKQEPYQRNESFNNLVKNETIECFHFENSHILLNRALKTIPVGAQTFSKSFIQYPENTSPMFLTHGQGANVWDVDGNEYVDCVSALMPVVLGYNDPDVNHAIQSQLQKGISFSLSTELELQLAEKLCDLIPSAQKVRFAKNGTDVTSAAVRLARAYTGRDKIIVCGYHGWQDWYIGTTVRNKGVPRAISDLSVSVPYNDLNKIEKLLKKEPIAGMIMEPCNAIKPADGYLKGVKDLCEKYGAVLIFDEIVTGFRFSMGGAQAYFDVTPHLSCFGKAMGNGMPISAIVGCDDIMKEMENIFFSGTFGGETLSLAASLATIEKMEKFSVVDYLWHYGQAIGETIEQRIINYALEEAIKLVGYGPWKIFQFLEHPHGTSAEIKTFFIQEMIRNGILINSSININFSHNELHKHKILNAIDHVLDALCDCLKNNNIAKNLKSPAIKPLFKLR